MKLEKQGEQVESLKIIINFVGSMLSVDNSLMANSFGQLNSGYVCLVLLGYYLNGLESV